MTIQFLTGVGQTVLVIVGAFAVLCALTSFLRFQQLTESRPGRGARPRDPQDALAFEVARRLGTVHRSPPPFCVIALAPAAAAPEGWRESVLRRLPPLLRHTDTIVPHGPDRVGLVIDAGRAHAPAILNRVFAQMEAAGGPAASVPLHIGLAAYPHDGDRAHVLVERADVTMAETKPEPAPPSADASAPPTPDPQRLVDELTGLLRPERVAAAVPKYLARYRRDGKPVSMLYLDVDRLEGYNRHYGRAAGDAILRGLGRLLHRHLREEDLICRFRGEEFLVLAGCSSAEALAVAQRLAAHIRRFSLVPDREELRITVSIGVASYPEHGLSPRQLFEAVELALQAAQARGRNMCLLYQPALREARRAAATERAAY